MPDLHDYLLSDDCYKVRLLLALLGIPHITRAVAFYPGREHEGEAFRRLNPVGDLPVLVDDGKVLRDPQVVLTHLASKHAPHWQPPDNRWLDFAGNAMSPLSQARLTRLMNYPGDLEALRKSGRRALRDLEDHLGDRHLLGHDWVDADQPTISDIALFPHVALSHDAGIGLEDYPALNLWQRRVRRLPRFTGMPGIPDYF